MRHLSQQPTVQLGQDITIPGREGTFVLFCAGSKAGRYWAVQRREGDHEHQPRGQATQQWRVGPHMGRMPRLTMLF